MKIHYKREIFKCTVSSVESNHLFNFKLCNFPLTASIAPYAFGRLVRANVFRIHFNYTFFVHIYKYFKKRARIHGSTERKIDYKRRRSKCCSAFIYWSHSILFVIYYFNKNYFRLFLVPGETSRKNTFRNVSFMVNEAESKECMSSVLRCKM